MKYKNLELGFIYCMYTYIRILVFEMSQEMVNTLYQFIFTTDEKPTVVYPILDEISATLAFSHVNWRKIDVFTLNIMVLMFSL